MFLFIFLISSGCDKTQNKLSPDAGTIVIGTPTFISLLKEYRINDNLSFTIDSISDYRCPQDVECIWSGDVDLLFNINQNGVRTDTLIHSLTNRNDPFIVGRYKWEVVEVTPARFEHQVLNPEDYQIEILIQYN
jgi:hypothetical protein